MNILAFDTSNQILAIALMKNNEIVAELSTNIKKDHSSRLMPAIVELMKKVHVKPEDLDKIVVAKGPGSYTGARIGVTTAKTMAWALEIPIIPVSSLKALAANGVYFDGFICPFFDARRRMVFTGLYRYTNKRVREVLPECNISMEGFLEKLKSKNEKVMFLSPHLSVYRDRIEEALGEQAVFPLATHHLTKPSHLFFISQDEENVPVHAVQPNYLRMTEAEANWLKEQKNGN